MALEAIAAIGLGAQVVGGIMSYSAQQQMINEQTVASKKAEANREQQMQLDAQRRRRQAIREGIMARSQNLAVATAQGAQGSGVQSALGGAIGMAQENQQGITSAEVIGGRIFQANRDYFDATQRGQSAMAIGQGISALGGALVSNAGLFERVGAQFSGGGATSPAAPAGNPYTNQASRGLNKVRSVRAPNVPGTPMSRGNPYSPNVPGTPMSRSPYVPNVPGTPMGRGRNY